MNAENQKAERVLKLLLETFPEHPRSESTGGSRLPDTLEEMEPPLTFVLAHAPVEHGIAELNSPLSE